MTVIWPSVATNLSAESGFSPDRFLISAIGSFATLFGFIDSNVIATLLDVLSSLPFIRYYDRTSSGCMDVHDIFRSVRVRLRRIPQRIDTRSPVARINRTKSQHEFGTSQRRLADLDRPAMQVNGNLDNG